MLIGVNTATQVMLETYSEVSVQEGNAKLISADAGSCCLKNGSIFILCIAIFEYIMRVTKVIIKPKCCYLFQAL